jgi:iron complex transport system substrate-binding protein
VRIVSLLPSATEIVYALGLGEQLEGVTFECDHPPEARLKPVVSSSGLADVDAMEIGEIDAAVRAATVDGAPLYRLDEALIASIRPDLILTQDLCRVCAVPSGDVDAALDRLGCEAEVVSLDPGSLEDVINDIERVGMAAGVPERAELVAASLWARVAAVEASVSLDAVGRFGADAQAPRVLVLEWVDPPYGAGHWIPDLVERAGGDPVLARPGGHSTTLTWSQVTEAEPDVVLVAPCGYHLEGAVEQARSILPLLAATPAGRAGQVWALDADGHVVRPGPRVVDGIEVMAWILAGAQGDPPHPDAAFRVTT